MIAIAVVGILAAIAFPSYQNYVLKSGRADAKTALYGAAQTLERCFTDTALIQYCLPRCGRAILEMTENDKYSGHGQRTWETHVRPDRRDRRAQQTKDTECGDFTLDSYRCRKGFPARAADIGRLLVAFYGPVYGLRFTVYGLRFTKDSEPKVRRLYGLI